MTKLTSGYTCTVCNLSYSKWAGQCTNCSSWGTIEKKKSISIGPKGKNLGNKKGEFIQLSSLAESEKDKPRNVTGIPEFDRVLGGGLVDSSSILLGGDPGIGKSTLLLQVASSYSEMGARVIYISGEEATSQIRMRARRLKINKSQIKIASETNLRDILTTLDLEKIDLIIIDSIQTIWADNVDSSPGSISQVRASVLELTSFAKKRSISVILVGHVTKEGQIAGPKVVEHMVDTVLYFEGDRGMHYRILRAVKNRFGPANEIGVFEMTSDGLQEVSNPSQVFLSERSNLSPGSVVFAALEGTRPVLVEIQALIANSTPGNARRTVVGWDNARLAMILAILDARCGLNFSGKDVYLNVAGGMKITEPAADFAVAAALVSANKQISLPSKSIVFGELSLSGALRRVNQPEARIKEAIKLGFVTVFMANQSKFNKKSGLTLNKYSNLMNFIEKYFNSS